MPEPDLGELSRALVREGIAGPHLSHRRASTLDKIAPLLAGDPDKTMGLSGWERYTPAEVHDAMARLTGCPPGCEDRAAEDLIDPALSAAAIDSAARRLAELARAGATLLVATGHPTGMLETYMRVADAYVRAGGKLLRLREEELLDIGRKGTHAEVRYVGGVGVLADWGSLKHTHRSDAMEALLQARPWPDAVLADHGFAGAAIARDIPAVAVVDINDHALAVAWAEGRDVTAIPLDDNRPPARYEPVWGHMVAVMEEASP